jgi:hypothetical protein
MLSERVSPKKTRAALANRLPCPTMGRGDNSQWDTCLGGD